MSGIIKRVYEVVGTGKFGSNSHPVHPATVHFPIAFLTLANILNILYGTSLYLPAIFPFDNDQENTGTITILAYFLNAVGILSAIPAVLTGFAELYAMYSTRGLFTEDGSSGKKKLDPIVRITLTHAGLNDFAVVCAIYNWLMERHRPHEDYQPYPHQIVLSAGALIMTLYAAFLGGSLVYKHSVGVQRMGSGAEEKEAKLAGLVQKTQ